MIAKENVSRMFVQTRSAASLASFVTQILGKLLAHDTGIGFPVAALHVRDNTLERMLTFVVTATVAQKVGEADWHLTASVENHLLHVLGQILERHIEVELVVARQALNQLEIVSVTAIPTADGAAGETQLRMVNHPRGIEKLHLHRGHRKHRRHRRDC